MSLKRFLKTLHADGDIKALLAHHEVIPAYSARYADPVTPLSSGIQTGLAQFGIDRLYDHQARAIDLVRLGKNVAAITPTASGKSLLYNIPVLEGLARETGSADPCGDRQSRTRPVPLPRLTADRHLGRVIEWTS